MLDKDNLKLEKNGFTKNFLKFFKKNIELIFIFISIPFFLLMNYYFITKENRNNIENTLVAYSIFGFFILCYTSFFKVKNFISLSNFDLNKTIRKNFL